MPFLTGYNFFTLDIEILYFRRLGGTFANLTMHIDILMKNVFQVEYLQKKNKELENRIQDLLDTKQNVTSEVVDLSNKNEELCQELNEIDHLAQQLERHKEIVLETADKEIGEAKVITNMSQSERSAPFYLACIF